MAKKVLKAPANGDDIIIPGIDIGRFQVRINGLSPFVMHRFAEKAKRQIEEKQAGGVRKKKQPRNPQEEYEASMYRLPGETNRYGFPAGAFKAACVSACRWIDGVTMTFARGAFYVVTQPGSQNLVEIIGTPEMYECAVRIARGTTDLRYRAMFPDWRADLMFDFDQSVIRPGDIVNILNRAGFQVGLGEHRPEKGGQFGMFRVATS